MDFFPHRYLKYDVDFSPLFQNCIHLSTVFPDVLLSFPFLHLFPLYLFFFPSFYVFSLLSIHWHAKFFSTVLLELFFPFTRFCRLCRIKVYPALNSVYFSYFVLFCFARPRPICPLCRSFRRHICKLFWRHLAPYLRTIMETPYFRYIL